MPGPGDNEMDPDGTLPPPPGPTTPSTDVEAPAAVDPPLPNPPPKQPPNEGGCCTHRSCLERCLLAFLLIVFLLFAAFLIGFVILYYWKGEPRAFCTEDSCVASAARINSFIDRSVNPCEDFYKYACGGWMKGNVIPDDQKQVTVYSQMRDEVKATLKSHLEEENLPTDLTAVQRARDFYASCVDTDVLESTGSKPLEKFVAGLGAWPALDSTNTTADVQLVDLLLGLSRVKAFALLPILSAQIKPDFEDPAKYAIYIGQGALSMHNSSKEAYTEAYSEGGPSRELEAYQGMLKKLLVELGAEESTAKEDAEAVVDFEVQLANISLSEEQKQNAFYDVVSVKELEKDYPDFDWVTFINGMMQYGKAPPQITNKDRIILTATSYLNKLFPLLDRTPARVQANYLLASLWRHAGYSSESFRGIVDNYHEQLDGHGPRSRWQTCVDLTDEIFPAITGRLFVQSSFGQSQKEYIVEMLNELKASFVDIIRQTEWLEPQSKDAAVNKAEAVKGRVGYPDYVLDDVFIEDRYEEYNMSRDAFFENVLRAAYLKNAEQVRSYRYPVDQDRWSFSAATVEAFYDAKHNELVLPAGFAQYPIYDPSYTRSMNFGSVGSFIGREITHGVDEEGSKLDADGQARQWWTPHDMVSYEEQARCMIDHYSCFRYHEVDRNVDGLNTLSENIADNSGVKQSYRAYRSWVEERGIEERMLPGLNLTHNQIFFISFAQLWCTNDRDEFKAHRVMHDKFAPPKYRVRGTLQNAEGFAEAFGCSAESDMNPKKKCKVW